MNRTKRELINPNFKRMMNTPGVRSGLFVILACFFMQASSTIAQCNADGGPDFDVCLNTPPVTLPGGGTWSGTPLVTPSGVFTPSVAGTYLLTYTIDTGTCIDTDVVTAIVHALPTTTAVDDITICTGQTAQLGASATSPNGAIILYTWSGGSVSNSLSQNPTATPAVTTFYNVTAVDVENCNDADQVTVFVLTNPTVNAGNDLTVCATSGPVQLAGFSPAGGTWSGTGVNATGLFTPAGTGNFTLTYAYTNAQGCTGSDQMVVSVISPSAINAGPDHEVCAGSSSFQLVPVNGGGTWAGTNVTSGGMFNPVSAGLFNLTYTLNVGACSATDQVQVLVNALPVANAGSDLSLCDGEAILLNGSVVGGQGPYSVLWSNGTSLSDDQILNPTATPAANTVYVLTVSDTNNCFDADDVAVVVNALPAVNAGSDITVCNQPIATAITTGLPAGGNWSGAGIDAAGNFIPSEIGNIIVNYQYTDNNGCTSDDDLTINVISPPVIDAGTDVDVCANDALQVLALNTSSSGTWSGTAITNSANGTFDPQLAGVGSFTITIASGTGSCYVSDNVQVEVLALPALNAGPMETFCADDAALMLVAATPAGGTWEGPGIVNAATGQFDPGIGTGVYNLMYFYSDAISGCTDTAYKNVTVASVPQAQFTLQPLVCSGSNLEIENTSSGATVYEWEFEGGDNSAAFEPMYSFGTDGTYWVKLVAENAAGCQDEMLSLVEIISAPHATFSLNTNEGCAPLELQYTNNSTGQYATSEWNYDGQTTFSFEPAPYMLIGQPEVAIYNIGLVMENMCGSDEYTQTVTVHPLPHADFSTTILSTVCSPVAVEFQNNSTGGATECYWNFGDGSMSTNPNPEINVYLTGINPTDYPIWLYVENNCGEDSLEQIVTVQPNLVNAQFNTSVAAGCEPLVVDFTDNGSGATQVTYDMGGLATSTFFNPQFTFDEPGDFTIIQYATDGCGFDTAWANVNVLLAPEVSISADLDEVCAGGVVLFESLVTDATTTEWDFGDGNYSSAPDDEHAFVAAGNYTVYFTATAITLCETSATMDVTVHANPVAAFSSPVENGCSPVSVCFENNSSGAAAFEWNFDDGTLSNEPAPCTTFENGGTDSTTENIELVAVSAEGCSDTAFASLVVHPLPNADFVLNENASCDFPVSAFVTGSPAGLSAYAWSVDGQFASNDGLPSFNFTQPGAYAISFTAQNEFGCENSSVQLFTVHPAVEADFAADMLSGCQGMNVQFENNAVNAAQFLWWFGTGDTSTQPNPTYTFAEPGNYDVLLTVTSPQGCTAETEMENFIEVFANPVADFTASVWETSILFPEIIFENNSDEIVALEWNFGDGTAATDVVAEHAYASTGTFPVTLTVWNENGCTDTETNYVEITSEFSIYVPNSFTPNGDGVNDVFVPVFSGSSNIHIYELRVFDRWGTEVFASNLPGEPWTGDVRSGSYFAETGTYYYRVVLQMDFSAEKREVSGWITMVR